MGPAAAAELALHLEVAATPMPGNVDRERDAAGLTFGRLQAGAVGARPGFEALAEGASVGAGLERAVAGAAGAAGENTAFGACLLLAPLVAVTPRDGPPDPAAAGRAAADTTVADAVAFYRALEHADVAVPDPPASWDALDARRGAEAVPAVRDRGVTLADVLARAAPTDRNAAEWTEGFPRTARLARRIGADEGPLTERAARAGLHQLATEPDTLVRTRHGPEVAREVRDRAATLVADGATAPDADGEAVRAFAAELVEREINPGTTADLVAAGLYVALRRGERP